ncbi:hypothetical protein SELMODRAFT_442906 [Selaginella moellendorffii]|uniref:CNH domain-containing protein n=1 Tax=Selaginella moellendorffii TaxID=88036 RepID=D8RX12_SELML|nr:vam6/Vps39-like protein [Selaginella moellendorffii]EFJ23179.1 hypothetical protein SELMODRAFT_442906 [Selaginella moellendorffii]|eukprot:XP_002975550.1 vam6/Vps39-like protein [Selaginella moellendorffii]
MVHNAFDDVCVVRDCPSRIESAIVTESSTRGEFLHVGCIDGSLRIYSLPDSSQDEEDLGAERSRSCVLRRTIVGFAKKAVSQMDLVKSRGGMLITLAEAVAVHSLPGFEPVAFLAKTKGANLFCWDERRGLLCVARHKKLLIYRHDGSRDFTEVKEISIPDVVKSMVWCGDCVCLGVKREYVFVNAATGASTDIFPCGRSAPPLVVSLPRGELLLGKDNIGVFVDQSGKVTPQTALSWSESPSAVMVHPPYILARLSRFIEVRTLREPYSVVQMIAHKDKQLLQSSSFGLLAASENSVYKLVPVAIGVQVVQLAASGNFEDALALCKLMPPEDASLRASKEDAIHKRYGQFLFSRGQYVEALQHFALSSMSLPSIIALFPSVKLPEFCVFDEFKDMENSGELEVDENNSNSVSTSISLAALATFLMNKRGDVIANAEAKDTDEALAALSETGHKHNVSTRLEPDDPRKSAAVLDTALIQALLLTNQSPVAIQLLRGSNYCDVDACREMMLAGGFYKELLELYQFNKMHKEALQLLARLVENPESFPVPPPKDAYGPEALVDYLQPLGGQDQTLIMELSTLILKLSPDQAMKLFTSTNPPLPPKYVLLKLKAHAPDLQIVYLEEMVKHNPDSLSAEFQNELILLYLSNVLEGKPDDSKSKLLTALETFTAYNARDIFPRFPGEGFYEEKAVLLGRMEYHKLTLSIYVHKLHNQEKALAYCDRVFDRVVETASQTILNAPVDHKAAELYSKLLEMYLRPKKSLKELKLALASLGGLKYDISRADGADGADGAGLVHRHKHKGHVRHKVTQIEDALSFTNGNESATESNKSDTEESVDGRTEDGIMLEEAIHLLSSRWDRFHGTEVLSMLPSDAKLKDLLSFLEPLLRRSTERSRNAAVIGRVEYSDHIEVRHELLQCRARRFRLTNETLCSICRKKIGPSVFAVYPGGAFAHFVCYSQHRASGA